MNYLALGLGALCLLGLLVLGYFLIRTIAAENELTKKRQNLFDEMRSILQTRLLPLGFEEKRGVEGGDKEGRRLINIYYSRGKTLVHLRMDTRDSLYFLAATRKLAYGDDFLIEGNLDQAEKFKSDCISILNEWIFKESIG